MLNARVHLLAALMICPFLAACGNSNSESEKKVEIKPAPKLTNDATTYANAAWKLINEIDVLVYNKQVTDIEEKVRKPIRQLSTDWRINVKMTDSVTEGTSIFQIFYFQVFRLLIIRKINPRYQTNILLLLIQIIHRS